MITSFVLLVVTAGALVAPVAAGALVAASAGALVAAGGATARCEDTSTGGKCNTV